MIAINVVCVGKLKEKFWQEACAEYSKRLSRFCKLKIIEIDDVGGEDKDRILSKEGEEIAKFLTPCTYLLAIEGKQISSEDFAQILQSESLKNSQITFVIGSSYGLCQQIKQQVKNKISLGKITLPHNLARVVLLEQIYRGFMISSGANYHK